MRSGKWWPWAVASIPAAAAVAVLVYAYVLNAAATGPPTAWEILGGSAAVVALGGLAWRGFQWAGKKTHDPPKRLPSERIGTAKRFLADAVDGYWKKESQYRDWEKRPLMQVRWRAPVDPRVPSHPGAVKNPPQTASSAEIAELVERFRACEPRRLVLLGGPGTGKTTLAVRLLLELLATREGREDEPVPVIIPVAQWDTDRYPKLQAWLSEQLYQDYPGLQWLGVAGVRQLVDLGHVLPILDGLDELPEPVQTTVVRCLNDSLGRDGQVILTSRTTEYIDAVGGGRTLDAAAVLEPLPVTPHAAADYLTRSLQSHQTSRPAWDRALEVLRTEPGSALAETAATPLGLWLLRAIYIEGDGDPDELTDPARFPTSDRLRAYLFGHLIAALLPLDSDKERAKSLGLSRAYQADDVERWLAFLAHHLSIQPSQHDPDHYGTRDFEWWRLAATAAKPLPSRVVGVIMGIVTGLNAGLPSLLVIGSAYGPKFGLMFGLMIGIAFGLIFGLSGSLTDGEEPGFAEDSPGYVNFRGILGSEDLWSHFSLGSIYGLMLGLMWGFIKGLAGGLATGLVESVLAGLAASLVFGLLAGLGNLVFSVDTPLPAAQAATPQESLRTDRILNIVRIACILPLSEIVLGLFAGILIGISVGLIPGFASGIICGSTVGVFIGVLLLLGGHHRAWVAYTWATWSLSREGALPRKLMPFLVDMHRLGLLRAVGRIYQFRHAELQDHLAEAYQRAD